MKELVSTIERLRSELIDLGVKPNELTINKSNTDFGNSVYLYAGNNLKVRNSDHGCGNARILDEIHLGDRNYNEVLERLERYFFPRRFKEVNSIEFGGKHEATDNKIKGLIKASIDFEMIEKDIKVSKRGNKTSIIRVKNQKVTNYIRK